MKTLLQGGLVLRGLAVAFAVLSGLASAKATPYATSLTNNAGTVSFRLNQTTATNDTVMVISSGGAVTNILQSTGGAVLTRGLIVTNLGIAAGPIQVRIKHQGSGVISTSSPTLSFGSVRGVTANRNPASPYFGWVYVSNANTNSGGHGDGIFAYSSDLADITGQGLAARNGGYTGFASDTSFSPYKISIAPDDSVLVCDDSDATANLIAMSPLLTNFNYVLKPIQVNPVTGSTGKAPVGTNNNHGSMAGAVIVGTGTNTVLYTMDEDYQTDPTSSAAKEWNSIWQYNIGAGPLPWSNAPNAKLMSPFLYNFAGQNQGLQYHQFGANHYLYVNQRRSNPPQHTMYIVDLDNPVDPNTYFGNLGGFFWASQDESLAEGYSDDVLRDMIQMTISSDGRWFAGIIAGGSATITAPDGSTFANNANDIIVIPLTNGIPNLAARQVFSLGGPGNGRDITFDAANNLYIGSSGLGVVQALDIGESTDVTTGTDGTFSFITPATQVTVSAPTPLAMEQGNVPGVFTLTRTPEDIGNPLTVFYTLTGTASNSIDYTVGGGALITTNSCVIAAGQTSTNITITPVSDNIPELSETVVLTVKGSGGYSVGFPNSATVSIADNQTPQLQVVSLSTNIYQGTLNDYASLRVRRLGDTNVTLTLAANGFSFGGAAVANVDYVLANLPVTIPAGVVDLTIPLIYPGANGSTAVGSRDIQLTLLPGAGYTVTNNTATTTLTLKSLGAENVLFYDNFEQDTTGSNWNVIFATVTNAPPDYSVVFGYDYTSAGLGNLSPIPPAPHTTNGETKGVYMTVNKSGVLGNNVGVASAVNLYLTNRTFGSNFALRFDMFLVRNSAGSAQSKVEYAIFGINHSGTQTNWFRNAQPGVDRGTVTDGLWFDVEEDGSGAVDFGAWSSPTYTNTSGVVGPTNFLQSARTSLTQVFKKPPYDAGPASGGVPANTVLTTTPTWSEVEVSQVGNLITWKINNTVILSFLNTNVNSFGVTVPYTNGTIMLGYDDAWDEVGNTTGGSGEACVIYDNVRVVSITPPTIVTPPANIVAPAGTVTNLSVVASTVTGTTNYQWQLNGTNVAGATSRTLSLGALGATNYGTYTVIVSDGAYSTTSPAATVLPPAPVINVQPVSRAAVVGSSPTFSVGASTFSGVTNYQWLYYGTNLAGMTSATLTLAAVQPVSFGGPYTVRVNDGFGSITSSPPAILTLAVPKTITNSINGTTLSLKFGTEFGPSYVVEYKTNLTDLTWKPLSTNVGTANPATVTDSVTNAQTGFYRLRLQ